MANPRKNKKVPGYNNVYSYYQSPTDARDKTNAKYHVKIRRSGKMLINKTGFNSAKEAAKAGDIVLLKEGYKQANKTFKKL